MSDSAPGWALKSVLNMPIMVRQQVGKALPVRQILACGKAGHLQPHNGLMPQIIITDVAIMEAHHMLLGGRVVAAHLALVPLAHPRPEDKHLQHRMQMWNTRLS